MSIFCRMRPLSAPLNSYNLDGGGAMRPFTVTRPTGVCMSGSFVRSEKLRSAQPRCTKMICPVPSKTRGVMAIKPDLPFIWRLSKNTVCSARQTPLSVARRCTTARLFFSTAKSCAFNMNWLLWVSIANCRFCFCAARRNCHWPSENVSATTRIAAVVNTQNLAFSESLAISR